MDERTAILPYGKQRCSRSRSPSRAGRACCCSTSPPPACPGGRAAHDPRIVAALPPTCPVLLIEHDMELVFQFAARISVLVNGAMFGRARPRRSRAIRASRRSISARPPMADLLQVEELSAGYGEALVLSDIIFHRSPTGSRLALLGRNGTGKTTLINSLLGLTTHRSGASGSAGAT
jgi:ABC-type branched-subunit amino acid transport system ATPase component